MSSTAAYHPLVNKILESPMASDFIDTLNKHIAEERKARKRFLNDIDEQVKAEFINGEVIVHSPVVKMHNDVSKNLLRILEMHVIDHDLGYVGIEKVMVRFPRNDYEPDLVFFKKTKSVHFKEDQKLFPIPDLVVEVLSKGTSKRDRGVKFEDYEKHGVQEYWIIEPKNRVLEQYLLKDGKYELNIKSASGEVKSIVVDGFEFPISIIFDSKLTNRFIRNM